MCLEIQNLTKIYQGKVKALDHVSFCLNRGIHGILGANGAGKSTLMQIITCNLEPTSGEVLWKGSSVFKNPEAYCSVLGYMPQQQAMYPTFTPAEYLGYMAELRKAGKERIHEILEYVGLSDVAGRKISALSGGMKQRLLLAQAVLGKPEVLILDEPTAGLDPYQRVAMRNLIASLASECVVLLATHVVQDLEIIAQDVLMLDRGKLACFDSVEHLYKSMNGKVYEVRIPDCNVPVGWKVSNMRQSVHGEIIVRVVSDFPPCGYSCTPVMPTLEDVFLYQVGGGG